MLQFRPIRIPKKQVFCVVPAPGFLNTTTALCTAYAVNAPVLEIIGQIPLEEIEKGHGVLHEIPDQLGILSSLMKYSDRTVGGSNARDI